MCLQVLHDSVANDPEYQQLREIILHRFLDHSQQLPESCGRFWSVREHLSIDDGLIIHGCCLLIPTTMRQRMLAGLHESHQGAVHTKQQARLTVYWPGIDNDIDNVILSCQLCQDHLPAHPKEPLIQKPIPLQLFQELAVNYCSYGGQQFFIHRLPHRLAGNHPNGPQHNQLSLDFSTATNVLLHCST